MMVSKADRIKAIERVRRTMASISGGSPSYKRRRAVYRALKRGDPDMEYAMNKELTFHFFTSSLEKEKDTI